VVVILIGADRVCPKCGTEVPADVRNCPKCKRLFIDGVRDRLGGPDSLWETTKEEAESAERQAPEPSEERKKQVMATKALPDEKTPREKAIENISEGFKEMPSKKVVEALLELSKHYEAEFLGFEVFPHLKRRLSTDVNLFRELVTLLVHPPKGVKVTDDLGYVLLEFLDTAAHGTGLGEGILQEYRKSMKKVIMNKKLPETVRAAATRSLAEEKSSGNVDVVRKLIKSESRELVDAAARVLWAWSRVSRLPQDRLYPKIVKDLAKHAKSKPDEVFKSPSIMRLFGYLKTDTANDVLDHLIKKAKKPEHWASLLSSVGSHSSHDQLAKMIQGVIDKPTPLTVDVLTGVISDNPSSMESLFTGGHHQQYAFALANSKIVDYPGWATHLTKLRNSTEPIVAQFARRATQILPYEKRLELHGLGTPKPVPTSGDTSAGGASEVGVEKGIVTDSDPFEFAYRGDALYNDGNTSHWHTGIYLGFRPLSSFLGHPFYFMMRGIHNARPYYGVLYFQAIHPFDDPDQSVQSEMGNVAEKLIYTPRGTGLGPKKDQGGFDCDREEKPYHGRRSPPGLSADTRANIAQTAIQLHGRGIHWYFAGMIKSEEAPLTGRGWKGTIGEIGKTRCDGLVEYCYEKNGVKVCGGKDPIRHWNIASAGKEKLDSHEELHTYGRHCDSCGADNDDWTQGELCPKTQAGGVGTDTTFEKGDVKPPEITAFHVATSSGDKPPKITFEIVAPESQTVFVRVTVKKEGDSEFHFMIADDYWRCGMPFFGTPVGTMNLMELPHSQSIYWFGKTADKTSKPPDYWGDDGRYEFRLEVVDQGGNVSVTRYFIRNLEWSGPRTKLLLTENLPSSQRDVSIVHCKFNRRDACFPVNVGRSTLMGRFAQVDVLGQGVVIPLPPPPTIRDIYDLEFEWDGTAPQYYTILVDGKVCEEHEDVECTESPVKVPLHFIIKSDDSYRREVTVQLGESDCTDTIIVELTPPSISAVPYMNVRSSAVYFLPYISLVPEDAINDAEISKGDVEIVDENATEADLREHPERSILVKGVPVDAPEYDPYAKNIPVFGYSYSWGYIKNPVYCDFDMVGLITPSNTRGSVKKTSSTDQPLADDCTRDVEDIDPIRFQICQSDSFFDSTDYENDVRRVFEFETTDVARQRVTGQLTFYAKSLLCILEMHWIKMYIDPDWGSLKDRLAIRVSEDLISYQPELDWEDRIALDQNLHEFARRLSVSMESVLDNVLSDQSIWARIRDEGTVIVRRNEKQLTELLTGSSGIENVEAAVEEINHTLATEYMAHIMNTLSRTALEMPEHQEGFREIVQRAL